MAPELSVIGKVSPLHGTGPVDFLDCSHTRRMLPIITFVGSAPAGLQPARTTWTDCRLFRAWHPRRSPAVEFFVQKMNRPAVHIDQVGFRDTAAGVYFAVIGVNTVTPL